MRISDWSSDVCSSDLWHARWAKPFPAQPLSTTSCGQAVLRSRDARDCKDAEMIRMMPSAAPPSSQLCVRYLAPADVDEDHGDLLAGLHERPIRIPSRSSYDDRGSELYEFGRASCRERVCQYV